MALFSGRIRAMDAALADSVFLDVTGRTAKRLLELAGDADEFVLPVTQEELAAMVGASRERVNKAIAVREARLGRAVGSSLQDHEPPTARATRRGEEGLPRGATRRRRRRRDARVACVVHEAVLRALVPNDGRTSTLGDRRRPRRACTGLPCRDDASTRSADPGALSRSMASCCFRTTPCLRHADHAVEGRGAIETAGGRRLHRVHAAHAEPETPGACRCRGRAATMSPGSWLLSSRPGHRIQASCSRVSAAAGEGFDRGDCPAVPRRQNSRPSHRTRDAVP